MALSRGFSRKPISRADHPSATTPRRKVRSQLASATLWAASVITLGTAPLSGVACIRTALQRRYAGAWEISNLGAVYDWAV